MTSDEKEQIKLVVCLHFTCLQSQVEQISLDIFQTDMYRYLVCGIQEYIDTHHPPISANHQSSQHNRCTFKHHFGFKSSPSSIEAVINFWVLKGYTAVSTKRLTGKNALNTLHFSRTKKKIDYQKLQYQAKQ